MKHHLLFSAVFISCSFLLNAQFTRDDYHRADSIVKLNEKILYGNVRPTWEDSTYILWYTLRTPKGKEFYLVDPVKMKKSPAFDHEKLAEAIHQASGKALKPFDLKLDKLAFSKDLKSIDFIIDSIKWRCDLRKYKIEKVETIKDEKRDYGYWGGGQGPL